MLSGLFGDGGEIDETSAAYWECCRWKNDSRTIEPAIEVFGEYNGQAIKRLREVFQDEYAKTEDYRLVFTYLWAFYQPSD
ncbi:hypothetical protein NY10_1631 [Carnobacterium antarcticum]|nr:hypothetical protein NY10_1631 [Carnobacterium sp. CP1]